MPKATTPKTVLIAYIPVLHEGYRHLLEKHPEATNIYLLSSSVTHTQRSLEKDIRAVSAEIMKVALKPLFPERTFFVAEKDTLIEIASKKNTIVMPDEDISHALIAEYFPENTIILDSIFLRWDKKRSLRQYAPATKTQLQENTNEASPMKLAEAEAAKSGDWWRQVGAVLVKDGTILLKTHNRHLPSDHAPYAVGDPRANFHAGESIELSTAIHAEALLIAQAAHSGLALEGTELYCTTFPCPPCAKLIAESGIKKLYFAEGYSMLDGEAVLRSAGVKIVRV